MSFEIIDSNKRKKLLFIIGFACVFAGFSVIYTANTYKDYTPVSAVMLDSTYDNAEEEYTFTARWNTKDNTEETQVFKQKKLPKENASGEISLWISPDGQKASVQSPDVLTKRGIACVAVGIVFLIAHFVIVIIRKRAQG